MTHFALLCPPFFSHVRSFEALGEALCACGHQATFVLNEGAERLVRPSALAVRTVGSTDSSASRRATMEHAVERAARPAGLLGILRTVAGTAERTDALCSGAPDVLRAIGAEVVLGDQMESASGLLARHLGLPFVSIACSLPIERDPVVPLPFLSWSYDSSDAGVRRNRAGERVAALLMRRQRRTIAHWAARFGLPACGELHHCLSGRLTISQTVEAFDFPRGVSASRIRHVGPIRGTEAPATPLPCELDPSRPFVFASLGTLQGHRLDIFRAVARACRALEAQLLVAHCGRLTEAQAKSIGATWVTDFAPQRDVLRRADVCVTHAGLNTALDALEAGVPLLAIPIAFDQPGVAARVVHHGLGLRVSPWRVSSGRVRAALDALIADARYRVRASALSRELKAAGGTPAAVELIARALADPPCAANA